MRLSQRCGLGNEDRGESGLACREGIRGEAGSFKARAARSAEVVRSLCLDSGGELEQIQFSARSCICADDGEIPRLQAAIPACRE